MTMDADRVLRGWSNRSGEYSPDYYAHYGPNASSELLCDVFDATVGPDATILELGCSSGRHLAHLHEQGYEHLSGIDINADAFEVMERTYPDLAATGTFYFDAIENVLTEFEDGQFDAVYSQETLQHIHRDNEWVFEDVGRVANDVLVTVEMEGDDHDRSGDSAVTYINDDFPLYYRNWNHIFAGFGFSEVDFRVVDRDTLRVFRRDPCEGADAVGTTATDPRQRN